MAQTSANHVFFLAWVYWFGYLLPTFYNEKCREFCMSGGSGSRHNWFCNYWLSCLLCLTSSTFCPDRIFRSLDISAKVNPEPGFRHFVSNFRTLRTRFSLFKPNFWPVYGGLCINIETTLNWAGAQNPTKSKDLDQHVHPHSLISLPFYWSVSSWLQIERSVKTQLSVSGCAEISLRGSLAF